MILFGHSTMSFSLTDVTVGSTYMKGKTMLGYDAVGRVIAVLPGIGIRVRDCDGRGVILWRDYQLVDEEAYDLADETVDDSRGMPGFPDCAFWESQGILPLFVASWYHYHSESIPAPPGFLTSILSAYRDEAEAKGGAFLRAWSRQATECLGYILTRSDAPALTLRDFPTAVGTKEQVVATLYETPKRPRGELTVPDAPARPTLPASDDEEEEPEDEDEEQEEQEEEDEEDEIEYIEDAEVVPEAEAEPKLFNLLTSSSFGPFVVMLIWAMYFSWLWKSA